VSIKFSDKSRVYGFIGERGQCKTLSAVTFASMNMANGIDVVSNVPIKGMARASDGQLYNVEARPFVFVDWLQMDESKRHVHLCLDEVNFLLASRRGNTTVNSIWQGILQQLRHFNLSISYTCININRVDTELRNQTDVLIFCKNAIYTNWGQSSHVLPGEYAELRAYDQSGLLTGSAYDPKNPTEPDFSILYTKPVWHHYNTEFWINPLEGIAEVKFAKDRFLINAGHGYDDESEPAETVPAQPQSYDEILDKLKR